MAALAIGLGGAVGELWAGRLLAIAGAGTIGVGQAFIRKNNGEKQAKELRTRMRKIVLATRFGYSLPTPTSIWAVLEKF